MSSSISWLDVGLVVASGAVIAWALHSSSTNKHAEDHDFFDDWHHYDKNEIRKGCEVFKVFTDKTGAEEPMWMTVESMKGNKVCGRLGNNPGTVNMHFMQKVCAKKKDILRTHCEG